MSTKVEALQAAARVKRYGNLHSRPKLVEDAACIHDYIVVSGAPEDRKKEHEMLSIEKRITNALEGFNLSPAVKSSVCWSLVGLFQEICHEVDTLKHSKPHRHDKKVFE